MMNQSINNDFKAVVTGVRKNLPVAYIIGVIANYLVNGAAVALFLYPILSRVLGPGGGVLAIVGALVIQFFRALIVLTDELHFAQRSTRLLVNWVAFGMTVFSSVEAWHLAKAAGLATNEFWSIFLFLFGVVIGGFILEVNLIKKMGELTDYERKGTSKPSSPTLPKPAAKKSSLSPLKLPDEGSESEDVPFYLNLNGATS
jgi:hypothetical protein